MKNAIKLLNESKNDTIKVENQLNNEENDLNRDMESLKSSEFNNIINNEIKRNKLLDDYT